MIGMRMASLFAFAVLCCQAQQFEAASIKLHVSNAPQGAQEISGIDDRPGVVRITNLPLAVVVRMAYGVSDYQFSGPAWLNDVRYDVDARTLEGYTRQQLGPLLRALLSERFKLEVHHETREVGGYALVVAKGGPKFREADRPRDYFTSRPGLISCSRATMHELVGALGGRLGRPVLDKTDLAASYDLKLEWAPDETTADTLPSLFTALQEQLGLRLETQKVPVDVVIVDRIERTPSEN
jgi:uncharacterized protein (TIGR03435 family)